MKNFFFVVSTSSFCGDSLSRWTPLDDRRTSDKTGYLSYITPRWDGSLRTTKEDQDCCVPTSGLPSLGILARKQAKGRKLDDLVIRVADVLVRRQRRRVFRWAEDQGQPQALEFRSCDAILALRPSLGLVLLGRWFLRIFCVFLRIFCVSLIFCVAFCVRTWISSLSCHSRRQLDDSKEWPPTRTEHFQNIRHATSVTHRTVDTANWSSQASHIFRMCFLCYTNAILWWRISGVELPFPIHTPKISPQSKAESVKARAFIACRRRRSDGSGRSTGGRAWQP